MDRAPEWKFAKEGVGSKGAEWEKRRAVGRMLLISLYCFVGFKGKNQSLILGSLKSEEVYSPGPVLTPYFTLYSFVLNSREVIYMMFFFKEVKS